MIRPPSAPGFFMATFATYLSDDSTVVVDDWSIALEYDPPSGVAGGTVEFDGVFVDRASEGAVDRFGVVQIEDYTVFAKLADLSVARNRGRITRTSDSKVVEITSVSVADGVVELRCKVAAIQTLGGS